MADTEIRSHKPQNDMMHAGKSGAPMAEAGRQGAQAMQQGGQLVGEAMRRTGEAAADTAQRAGDTAREAVRRNAEAFAETQRQFAQKAAEQFEEASRKIAQTAQGTSADLRTFMMLPNAANGGLQDLHQSMTGLIQGVVRTNLRAAQALFQLANPGAIAALQQRFMREYLDALMQGTATMVRAARRTADETLRPLEQQIEQRQRVRQSEAQQQAAE